LLLLAAEAVVQEPTGAAVVVAQVATYQQPD
jgi:hypothetical protein